MGTMNVSEKWHFGCHLGKSLLYGRPSQSKEQQRTQFNAAARRGIGRRSGIVECSVCSQTRNSVTRRIVNLDQQEFIGRHVGEVIPDASGTRHCASVRPLAVRIGTTPVSRR
jgi:hypothetical protein